MHFAFRVSLHVKEPISSWTTPTACFPFVRPCLGTDAAIGSVAAALGSTGRSERHLNRRPATLDGPSLPRLSPCPVRSAVQLGANSMCPQQLTVKWCGSAPCQQPSATYAKSYARFSSSAKRKKTYLFIFWFWRDCRKIRLRAENTHLPEK